MSDAIVSRLRTIVPVLWGSLIAWLLRWLGGDVDAVVVEWLLSWEEVLVVAVVAAFYSLARWLERQPWLPAWVAALLLGSSLQPTYPGPPGAPPVTDGAAGALRSEDAARAHTYPQDGLAG